LERNTMPRPAVLIAGAIAVLAIAVGAVRFVSGFVSKASPEDFTRLTYEDLTINIESDAFGLSKGGVPQASGRVRVEHSTLTLIVDQSNTRIAAIGAVIDCQMLVVDNLAVECSSTVTPFPAKWTAHLD
jgi:hypothetical protein